MPLLLRSRSVRIRSCLFAAISAAATPAAPSCPFALGLRRRGLLLRRALLLLWTLLLRRPLLLRTTAVASGAPRATVASALAGLLLLRTRINSAALIAAGAAVGVLLKL